MSRSPRLPVALLDIRVLGPLEVLAAGEPVVVDTRKALAILVLLAVERRPFARDELAAMLWPESDDESSRGALRRTLSVLRSALGDRWIRVDRSAVALDLADVALDLARVEAAAAVAVTDLEDLRAATSLARGPFLAGFSLRDSPDFDDWRVTRAVAIDRTTAVLFDRLADAAEGAGEWSSAVAAASHRVEHDPLDERAQRRLIGILAASGDRTGAIRQYRACLAVLDRELGVAPLAETTALYDAIREALPFDGRPAPAADEAAIPGPRFGLSPTTPVRLPMVGRDAELARLVRVHRDSGVDGRLVLLVGEAGIGKTRLSEELGVAVEAAGGRTLAARAFPTEGGIAYGPVMALLRSGFAWPDAVERLQRLPPAVLREVERLTPLPAELGRAVGTDRAPGRSPDQPAARARLLDAVATTLAALVAGTSPGLICAEDLQWADDASRGAVLYLARRLTGRPLTLLLSWRPEDLDARGVSFADAAEQIPPVEVISIDRLARDDVARLVAVAAGGGMAPPASERLHEESEGLPLYVVEALAAGPDRVDGPPRGVRALLRERLAGVGETAGQVLAAAAVVGRSFDLATVRGTSGRSEDETITALEELVRRGIVRELRAGPGDAFDFSHAKLRDAAYEGTSLARRRLLHRRTAELLRAGLAGHDDDAVLVQLANHERAAGRDVAAADAFRDAGLRARALFANREAVAHLELALALGHPDVAGTQLLVAELRTAMGDYAGAVAALEAAAAVTPDRILPGVELRLARVHARRGDLAAAASHVDAAIDAYEPGGAAADPGMLVRALVERAIVANRARAFDVAAAAASRALALAEDAGDPVGAGAAWRMLGLVARERGDLGEARAALGRSLALSDPDVGAVIAARNALALVEAAAGNRDAAIALLEAARTDCRRVGELHLEAAVENNLADQLRAAGRGDEAMEHLKRAVSLFADVGGRPGELEPEIWKLVTW